jgi:ssDNA-binding Zn-finger/Zn-ribbon topoisomerase 1
MVDLVAVLPSARLDRTEFDPHSERMDEADYTCPRCKRHLRLRTTDFLRHFGSGHSNICSAMKPVFDKFRPVDPARNEYFLDFHCPGCATAARILYTATEVGMGVNAFTVFAVIETAS